VRAICEGGPDVPTVVGASALLPDRARLAAWALVVVGWLAGITVLDWRSGATRDTSTNASESMIERFDLFTIIVLGEVVVGVVNGIADADRTPIAVVTGILGLGIGFAYWWSYFDLVGARRVRSERGALSRWLIGHLPVTMTIAATGAVMVSMVEHASGGHAPAPPPWCCRCRWPSASWRSSWSRPRSPTGGTSPRSTAQCRWRWGWRPWSPSSSAGLPRRRGCRSCC
jgi:hypothetical protein